MGNSEEEKSSERGNSSSPAVDQSNVHVYPDWAAMQAFYGVRLPVPPYLNSVASHAPPPYMWGPPQSMIPPYGPPYAPFYAHGGVYAHPGVTLAGTALSTNTPIKSSGNTDGGFVKKLKEFDGLAISIGNQNSDSAEDRTDHKLSQSDETAGSSDESNVNNQITAGLAGQNGKKRSRRGSPNSAGDGKVQKQSKSTVAGAENGRSSGNMTLVISPVNIPAKTSESMNTELELKDSSNLNVKSSSDNGQSEPWLQNERDLKRERRKQSNRESARRSRLRKQAEAEELAIKVQALTAENMTLKSEINKQMGNSKKLKIENAKLKEKLKEKEAQNGKFHVKKPVGTVNLLARVNNSDSTDRRNEDGETYDNISPGPKLHQLLDNSPRNDAVAAG